MPVALPRETLERFSQIVEPDDFAAAVFDQLGDLDHIEVMLNRVLCATYIGHEKTAGGIIKPQPVVAEDIWQNKCALVIKTGPAAFISDSVRNFFSQNVEKGDWAVFKVGNSSQVEINGVPCRIVYDEHIEVIVTDPRMVTS